MANCTHLGLINPTVKPSGEGCKECLETGGTMGPPSHVRDLRHVGCCDSSHPISMPPKHFHKTKHPIMRSFEAGESWHWLLHRPGNMSNHGRRELPDYPSRETTSG